MLGFAYRLHAAGIPVSIQYLIDLYRAIQDGLVTNLDQLFILSRLIFVKRIEDLDTFEQIFADYFLGASSSTSRSWDDLLDEKPLKEWLQEQEAQAKIFSDLARQLTTEELLNRFWETLTAQRGKHHGGATWVGTLGSSPFGHSGTEAGGIRVMGQNLHGTAQKIIGQRNFVNYTEKSSLSAENLRQVLLSMKSLRPLGPQTELNIDETIQRTAQNGGDIELVFDREMRNRVRLLVLLDNGGFSMTPFVPLVKVVFDKIRDLFRDVNFYYFHNCIYGEVFRDPPRRRPLPWEHLIEEPKSTRLIIIGDANMAPSELMAAYGSLGISTNVRKPGIEWLRELKNALPASVWLNPIPKSRWGYESTTIQRIRQIFYMEDLTLGGIKNAVSYLNIHGNSYDRL